MTFSSGGHRLRLPVRFDDGDPQTVQDPTWTPLLPTANHPEFPSGHTCYTGAVVQASLQPGTTQATITYERFTDALEDIIDSRIYIFGSIGYSQEDPEHLMKALRDVAEHGEVVSSAESVHGEKYVVDGWLPVHTQESRQWSIRTVWIIDRGKDAPRLVTAYPGKE